jgi:hypothetical protein
MAISLKDNIKDWYIKVYEDEEEFLIDFNPDITFFDLIDMFKKKEDFYEFTKARDSIVRENIFSALVDALNNEGKYEEVTYDDVYTSWLELKPLPLVELK